MKAIALRPGTTDIFIENRQEPSITVPTQVKVQVLQVGICGTDREEAAGGRADAPAGHNELVIGHEMFGQVIETGTQVKDVRAGDYGLFMVRRGCGECIACKGFRSDMCYTGKYTERGIKGEDGYEAEYVVDEEEYFIKADKSIAHIAVLTEPLSVVEKAIDEIEKVQHARLSFLSKEDIFMGRRALVAGLGPVGLLAALALKLRGAELTGVDIVEEGSNRVKLLKKMGGKYISNRKVSIAELQREYGEFDIIIEAAGVAKLEFNLIDLLGVNGVYALTGIPGDKSCIEVPGAELIRQVVLKNQVIIGSVNASKAHYEMAIEDLKQAEAQLPGVASGMITTRYKVEEFKKALTTHASDEIKAIIEWKDSDHMHTGKR